MIKEIISKKDNTNILNVIKNVHTIANDNPALLNVLFTDELLEICLENILDKMKVYFEKVISLSNSSYLYQSNEDSRKEVLLLSEMELLTWYNLYSKYTKVIDCHQDIANEAFVSYVQKYLIERKMIDGQDVNNSKIK